MRNEYAHKVVSGSSIDYLSIVHEMIADGWEPDGIPFEIDEVTIQRFKRQLKQARVSSRFNFKKALVDKGGDPNLVSDWLKVRSKKRAANTETAFDCFISEVESSGKDINEVLRKCVDRSWKGFRSSWLDKDSEGRDYSHLDRV